MTPEELGEIRAKLDAISSRQSEWTEEARESRHRMANEQMAIRTSLGRLEERQQVINERTEKMEPRLDSLESFIDGQRGHWRVVRVVGAAAVSTFVTIITNPGGVPGRFFGWVAQTLGGH